MGDSIKLIRLLRAGAAQQLRLLVVLCCSVAATADSNTTRQVVADFSAGTLSDWQQKSFQGNSFYRLVMQDGQQVLKATSKASASALYRHIEVDLTQTPLLNWRWRVDTVDESLDPLQKAGDDYSARIYVVKKGFWPWQTKALNYVWANSDGDLAYWPNPFTASAVMIPVQAGRDGLGLWHQQQVNVKADFKRFFNVSIDHIDGVAIMSDSDNGQGMTRAYIGSLHFSAD